MNPAFGKQYQAVKMIDRRPLKAGPIVYDTQPPEATGGSHKEATQATSVCTWHLSDRQVGEIPA